MGFASVILLAFHGRIAGVSGILDGIFSHRSKREKLWRFTFVLGIVVGAHLYTFLRGTPPMQLQAERIPLLLAGLLVGFGTKLGSGCTSGHGVCGLARRSKRSLVETLTFMIVAMITVYLRRHISY
ncbi:MAG: YeeE/YedE family protein [Deltaproteobacteria bacterium]|nr:YeeE/YedE family protein [Deltaproteobacteria bacterium]